MIVESLNHAGLRIEIHHDDDPYSDPRDACNFGRIVCWHRKYSLGDTLKSAQGQRYAYHDNSTVFYSPEEFQRWWEGDGGIKLPLILYDHSGITISVGSGAHWCDPGGWDSSQVGWTYATEDMIRKEYSVKRITKSVRAKAEALLRAELETYDSFIRGEVFGFIVKEEDEEVASCWGFVGDQKYCIEEAKAASEAFAKSCEGSDKLMRL